AMRGITAFNAAWSSSLSHQHVRCTPTARQRRVRLAAGAWPRSGLGNTTSTPSDRFLSAAALAWPRANSRLPDIVDQLIGLVGSPYRTVSTDASVALVLGALTLMIGGTAPGYAAINHLFYVPDWQARRILCRCLATVQLSDHSNKAEVCTVLAPVSDPHCPKYGSR
uniref:ABC transmembrane type-1 domain-containing protein n=1 Tax=Macrostomum lignano TaxID=282301 RepID=A0A1I8FM96_9PLAT